MKRTNTWKRSDDILVSSTWYDFAGNATEETDAADTVTCREYDNADRVVTLLENCQCESSSSSSSAADVNRTTRYEYTDDSLLAKLLCENASTGLQVTEWEYGVSQATGSELA
ncbi:MAG: hypothetical protein KA004_02315, partial [Verrucomicrobiales bacterium]|nr:hypothetical protein [Verrucomicrobiales bacterium]